MTSNKMDRNGSPETIAPNCTSPIRIESHPTRPAYSSSRHSHPWDSLFLVVAGKGSCVVETQEYLLAPRMSLFLSQGTHHSFVDKARSAMTIFVVSFDPSVSHQHVDLIQALKSLEEPKHVPVFAWQHLRLLLRQMLHEQNVQPPHHDVALQNLLCSVLLLLSRVYLDNTPAISAMEPNSTQRVQAVLEFIAHSYYQNYSLEEAAKLAQLSPRRFSSLCREICGRSFVNYVNALRIERARNLLETTPLPVTAVAFQVGFEELSTFYRAFRKHTGHSPRANT